MAYRYQRTFYGEQQEKDQLLLQLSAQLDALRLNQQDYVVLESQAQIIRQKYAALQAEKVRLEDMQERIKQSYETKSSLLERELSDYQRESNRLRNEVKLSKQELEDTISRRDELAAEVRRNQAALDALEKEKAVAIENGKVMDGEKLELKRDITALKEDIAKWELLKGEYLDQIASYNNKTALLKKEIGQAMRADEELQHKISKVQAETRSVEQLAASTETSLKNTLEENQKLFDQLREQKTECIECQSEINRIGEENSHFDRLLQFEEKKSKQLTLAVNAANGALSQKQTELEELKRRCQLSRQQQKSLEEENHELEKVYENLAKHIATLTEHNSQLQQEVEKALNEDREIRSLLNSKTMLLQPRYQENCSLLQPKNLSQSRSTTGNCFSRTLEF